MADNLTSLRKKIQKLETKIASPVSAIPAARNTSGEFQVALKKFSSDPAFRKRAMANPALVTSTFSKLTLSELNALKHVAILSGVDAKKVNGLRNSATIFKPGGLVATDINVSCCCCCCCGETSVMVA